MTDDLNTLICLFHHQDFAQTALEEILEAGIPEANVTLIGAPGSSIESSRSSLAELNVPPKDLNHLLDGVKAGGAVLSVSAISSLADKVEAIFEKHSAGKIDEADVADDRSAEALPAAAQITAPYADEGVPALTAIPLAAAAALDVDDYPGNVQEESFEADQFEGSAPAMAMSRLGAELDGDKPDGMEIDELIVVEEDLLVIPDPVHSTAEVQAFEVIPVVTETVISLDGSESVTEVTEVRFDPSLQPVFFSPQVH